MYLLVFVAGLLALSKISMLGRSPWLKGIVNAYHQAAPGSSPKLNIKTFSIYIVQNM